MGRCRAVFGSKGYGAVLGAIATPVLVVNAASPSAFTWITDHWDWEFGRMSLLVGASAAWIAMELMSRWYEGRRRTGARVLPGAAASVTAPRRGLRRE